METGEEQRYNANRCQKCGGPTRVLIGRGTNVKTRECLSAECATRHNTMEVLTPADKGPGRPGHKSLTGKPGQVRSNRRHVDYELAFPPGA